MTDSAEMQHKLIQEMAMKKLEVLQDKLSAEEFAYLLQQTMNDIAADLGIDYKAEETMPWNRGPT